MHTLAVCSPDCQSEVASGLLPPVLQEFELGFATDLVLITGCNKFVVEAMFQFLAHRPTSAHRLTYQRNIAVDINNNICNHKERTTVLSVTF